MFELSLFHKKITTCRNGNLSSYPDDLLLLSYVHIEYVTTIFTQVNRFSKSILTSWQSKAEYEVLNSMSRYARLNVSFNSGYIVILSSEDDNSCLDWDLKQGFYLYVLACYSPLYPAEDVLRMRNSLIFKYSDMSQSLLPPNKKKKSRPRWSRGNVVISRSQVCGFKPG